MEKNTIGDRLRELRYSMDLTQEKLGEKADLHYSYIGQVERGDKTPSLKSLIKIARALNISPEELIKDEKEEGEIISDLRLKCINNLLADRSPAELELVQNMLKNLFAFLDSYEGEEIKEDS